MQKFVESRLVISVKVSICSKHAKLKIKAILNRNQYQKMLKSKLCFGGCGKC